MSETHFQALRSITLLSNNILDRRVDRTLHGLLFRVFNKLCKHSNKFLCLLPVGVSSHAYSSHSHSLHGLTRHVRLKMTTEWTVGPRWKHSYHTNVLFHGLCSVTVVTARPVVQIFGFDEYQNKANQWSSPVCMDSIAKTLQIEWKFLAAQSKELRNIT